MLPMQNSKLNIDLKNILKSVEFKTKLISDILRKNSDLQLEEMHLLNQLYRERRPYFDKLENYFNSQNDAINFTNDEKLKNRINDLIKSDKLNLSILDKKVKDIKSKISNLEKNKSLLIYTKY